MCNCSSAAEIVAEAFIFVLVLIINKLVVSASLDGNANSVFDVAEEHFCSVSVCPVGVHFVGNRSIESIMI